MQKNKIVVGLCLSFFLLPHLEAFGAAYEYGWLQNSQIRTFENKRLRAAQRKEKIRQAKAYQLQQKERIKVSAEKEALRLEALAEKRKMRREKAIKEAQEEETYQGLLQERAKKAQATKKAAAQKKRMEREHWTRFSRLETNKNALKTRTNYATRKLKKGYVPVSKVKLKSDRGFVGNYMKQKTQNEVNRRKGEPDRYRGFYRRAANY